MTPSSGEHDSGIVAFRRAVDALCLSREQIARGLGVDTTALDEFVAGTRHIPPVLLLALVDLVKTHESRLGAAAAALYEQAMLRLTLGGDGAAPKGGVSATPVAPPPNLPPSGPRPGA